MKILILSTNTGEGHNSAGKAVLERAVRCGIPCEMKDVLSFASEKVSKRVCGMYIWSTVSATRVFSGAYRAGNAIRSATRKSPVYFANELYARSLYQYIVENGFDTIVMPHLFPAEALTYIKEKFNPAVRTYFVATDYTCIPFTEETTPDYFFIPHAELADEFAARGIPGNKLVPTGIPVSERFLIKAGKEEARKLLAIRRGIPVILVMTGSMGFGNVEAMVSEIVSRMPADAAVYILGGRNERLKGTIRARFSEDRRIHVMDYTNQVPLYMDAADLLYTKPGGLTSTEAAARGIPLVFTSPIPGCEEKNVAFFERLGMAVSGKTPKELAEKGMELLTDSARSARMVENQRRNINNSAAQDICEFIVRRDKE